MSTRYRLKGAEEMSKLLRQLMVQIGPEGLGTSSAEIKAILLKPAEKIRDRAKALVPKDTHNLEDNIYASTGPDKKPGVIVGVNSKEAPYGINVEYGTSNVLARPFLRPAMAEAAGEFPNNIAPEVEALIAKLAAAMASTPPKT